MKNYFLASVFILIATNIIAQNERHTDSLTKVRIVELNKLKPLFKAQKNSNDSLFAAVYSDLHPANAVAPTDAKPGSVESYSGSNFPGNAEKEFTGAQIGDVLGPYISGNTVALYKVKWKGLGEDSVQVRHILIAYKGADRADPGLKRRKWQAKLLADSLCSVIISGKTGMVELVLPFTDDPGSKYGNLGNYGWFGRESGFVKEFKDAGFNNPVGATVVIETPFGYHVIQVVDKAEKRLTVKAIPLERVIDIERHYRDQVVKEATTPAFPGGITALRNYFKENMHYPPNAVAKHIEANIEILFRVGTDGNAYDIIVHPGEDPEITAEAKRLIEEMPLWRPGVYKDKPADWFIVVTIPFWLKE